MIKLNLSSVVGRIASYSSNTYSMQYDMQGILRGYYIDEKENIILIIEAECGQLIKRDMDFIKLVK